MPKPAQDTSREEQHGAESVREIDAVEGGKEHWEKLEVERQAVRTWTTEHLRRQAEAGEGTSTGEVKDGSHHPTLSEKHTKKKRKKAMKRAAKDAYDRQERVLDVLAGEEALPEELVLLILEHVACRRPVLELLTEHTLPAICDNLMGTSRSAMKLRPILEQILLERNRTRLSIPFTRQSTSGGGDPIAQVPTFVRHLPYPIRHLEMTCGVELPRNRMVYPITIFRLTRGAASLGAAFPGLEMFTLLLTFLIDDDTGNFVDLTLDTRCFCGYTATTSYRELVPKLLEALYADGPGRIKSVKLAFEMMHFDVRYEGQEVLIQPTTPATPLSSASTPDKEAQSSRAQPHPMADILKEACIIERLAPPPKPIKEQTVPLQGGGTWTPHMRWDERTQASTSTPGYSERSNEDMLMLEEETRTVGFAGELESDRR